MGTIEERINAQYDTFTENERHICSYLLHHRIECYNATISDFAVDCHVSESAIVRFAKKLGYSGYGELKAYLKLSHQTPKWDVLLDTVIENYHKMLDTLLVRDLTPLFSKINSANRIFLVGSGSTQAAVASEMKRIFLPVREMIALGGHDTYYALRSVASKEDIVFLISLSGEYEAIVNLGKALRELGVFTISITRLGSNTLASVCAINLYIHTLTVPAEGGSYEMATPYFILAEYLYLSYCDYLAHLKSGSEHIFNG